MGMGLVVVGLIASLVAAPARAAAGINQQINFQGRLLTNTGAVVADGTYNMRFKIWQDGTGCNPASSCNTDPTTQNGGTLKWTETWQNSASQGVVVKNGYFSVPLGSITAFGSSVDWNQSALWLSMDIGGTGSGASPTYDGQMIPFKRLSSAVYALQAQSCVTCILQAPTNTTQNTISPTGATTGLTVNGSSTATTAFIVNQAQGADAAQINVSGAATNGLLVAKTTGTTLTNAIGITNATGTTNNAIAITNSSGTLSNGLIFSGTIGADITTGTNRDLTVSPNGTGKVVIGGTTPTVTSGGALTVSTGSNGAVNLSPNGTGDVVATLGNDSQLAVNATPTADTAQDSVKITLNPTITGSTATLQGLVISQSDNGNTGVYDSLVKIENLKTPETTTNGLFVQQNAASGTLSNGIQVANNAGTLSTGLLFSGTIGKEIQLQGAETIDNTTNGTINLAADSGGVTLKLTGTSGSITNSAGALGITATTSLNLTGAGNSTWSVGAGNTLAVTSQNFNVTGPGAGTFASTLAVQGASVTVGASALQGSLVLNDGSGGQTATIQSGNIGANTIISIPAAVGTTDTFCLVTLANCAGATGANQQLSNLSGTVAVNLSLVPQTTNSINLGSSSVFYTSVFARNLTFDAGAAGAINFSGAAAAAGNNLTLTGQTAAGANAGGAVVLQGGAASATSGSAGGGVQITAANGTGTSTGGAGGAVQITAGNGTSSGNNNGGNLTLTAGSPGGGGSAVAGAVIVKNASDSTGVFKIQNAAGTTTFFNADSTNQRISVGTNGTAAGQLYVSGGPYSATATGGVSLVENANDIATQGRYLYVKTDANIKVVDVTRPGTPATVSTFSLGTSGGKIKVAGKYAYVITGNNFYVVDISNPQSLSTTSTTAVTSPIAIAVQGRYVYIATAAASNPFLVYDVSNPGKPAQVSSTNMAQSPTALDVQGRYVYHLNGNNTLSVVDVSNPASPSVSGTTAALTGSVQDVAVQGRYAYVASNNGSTGGLQPVDVSNPSSPASAGSAVAIGTLATSVTTQGRYAYVGSKIGGGSGAYTVIDISNPTSLSSVSSQTGPTIVSLVAVGRYLYTAENNGFGTGAINAYDLGGAYVQQLEAGGIETNAVNVNGDSSVAGNESVSGGLQVGQNVAINGNLGIAGATLLQNSADSTAALQVQTAAGLSVLTVSTSGGTVALGKAGTGGINGKLIFNTTNASNFASSIAAQATQGANIDYLLPTAIASSGQCLTASSVSAPTVTLGFAACGGGGGVTTVGAFSGSSQANGATISTNTITFGPADGTNPGMVTASGSQTFGGNKTFSGNLTVNGTFLQNNASTTAFVLQDGSGNNALVLDSTNSELKVYENIASPTRYASIKYDNATSTAIFAASSGTTQVGSGTGNVNVTLTNNSEQFAFSHTGTNATSTDADFLVQRNLTGTTNALQGAVMKIEDLSSFTSGSSAPDVLSVNQNNTSATGNLIVARLGGGSNDKFKVNTAGTVTIASGQSYTGAGAVTFTGTGAVTVGSGSNTDLTLQAGGTGNIIANMASTGDVLIQDAGSTFATFSDTAGITFAPSSAGDFVVNEAAGANMQITATAVPTVDQLAISNAGQAVTTAGVNGLSVNYVGGAAAVESAGMRVDFTPGGTSGGTWSGLRIVANATGAASGVTEYGIKLEGPTSPGTGQETGLYVGTGWDIGMDVQSGGIQLLAQSDPATPAASNLRIYAKDIAGRIMPKWVGPAGVDTPFQANLGFNRVAMITPAGGGTCASAVGGFSSQFTLTGTAAVCANPTPASTNLFTSVRRTTIGTGATAGNISYLRQNTLQVWRGNAAGLGGFFFTTRFGTSTLQTGNRAFVGLADSIANPTNVDPTTSTTPGKVGMAINASTGNWKVVNNVTGTAPTSTDLGANFPVNTTSLYELIIFSAPNGSAINYRVTNLSTGSQTSGSWSTNIPTNTTFLAPLQWITNNATAASAVMDFAGWYLESDN
jgi:hypothetical protein